jgi:hypothetical protein
VELDVRLEKENIWLNLNQMAELFDRDKSVISRHLRNVFQEGELEREAVVAKNATTAADGKTYQVDFYNLDAIISVGYRGNSKRGTPFRIWATRVLRDHVLKGYTVNENRLRDMNQAVRLVTQTATRRDLSGDEAKALLRLVGDYGRALELLDEYDREQVEMPETTRETVHLISHEEALRIIERCGRTSMSAFPIADEDLDRQAREQVMREAPATCGNCTRTGRRSATERSMRCPTVIRSASRPATRA